MHKYLPRRALMHRDDVCALMCVRSLDAFVRATAALLFGGDAEPAAAAACAEGRGRAALGAFAAGDGAQSLVVARGGPGAGEPDAAVAAAGDEDRPSSSNGAP